MPELKTTGFCTPSKARGAFVFVDSKHQPKGLRMHMLVMVLYQCASRSFVAWQLLRLPWFPLRAWRTHEDSKLFVLSARVSLRRNSVVVVAGLLSHAVSFLAALAVVVLLIFSREACRWYQTDYCTSGLSLVVLPVSSDVQFVVGN